MGLGLGNPNFFLHISFSWAEISFHVEFHPPGLPRSGRFMVGDKKQNKKQQQQFHGFNGFLSLQLGLSFELGLRLRLTNFNTRDLVYVMENICGAIT